MEKKHTFTVGTIIRQNRKNNDNLVPIYLRITCDCKRAEVSIKILVSSDKWSSEKGRIKGNSEETRRLNNSIDVWEHRAREIYDKFIQKGKTISADTIKKEMLGIFDKQFKLKAIFDDFVSEIEAKKGIDYTEGTIKNWKVTQRHLEEYLKINYSAIDIFLKELDLKFIEDFELYAKINWKCGSNAASKHIQRIRKIVTKCVKRQWLETDPFVEYESTWEETHRTFLTDSELKKLTTKKIDMERLERVRDIFVFSCYTGYAYVDVEKLTPNNIVTGIDKKLWIYKLREKTDGKSNVPLLPQALSIIEKYKANSIKTGRLLPVITNIKTNAYLKEIADICDIPKNLTFHMARHTFATTITLSNGVPMETVSNMLGHKKIPTTQIYAKVLENKTSNDMADLEKRLLQELS